VPAQAAGRIVGLLAKERLQGDATGGLIGSGQVGQEGAAFTAEGQDRNQAEVRKMQAYAYELTSGKKGTLTLKN
jgi:hypothetical protein